MAPRYISDEELIQCPVIVFAKWDKASFKPHHRIKKDEHSGDDVITTSEAYTVLNVLRVIKGTLKPGNHPLMLGSGIAWSKEGKGLTSASSTELPGDVKDVTTSNIWFLNLGRSWDVDDKSEHLSIANYRAIQPAELEQYFTALASSTPTQAVPKLLGTGQPEVVRRALRYICGGMWPWPHGSEFERSYLSPINPGRVLREEAERVVKVIENQKMQDLRPLAVAIYAELKGPKCAPYVRTLLTDGNPDIRDMAVGVLARSKDEESVAGINVAATGCTNASMACKIIESLRGWGDVRLVPALISFLQNGNSAGFQGDDLFIPAIKAKDALREMTGHVFPFDVVVSKNAWEKAKGIGDRLERQKLLAVLAPGDAMPLKAELIGTNKKPLIRVTNITRETVTVAKLPSYGKLTSPGAWLRCGFGGETMAKNRDSFVTLEPGLSIQFEVELPERFLLANPAERNMTVIYGNIGAKAGVKAWIGAINVQPANDWNGERKVEKVEETWPNGNLKATGETVNGQRSGEWNYFNEQGDRIKIVYYLSNRGTATCNPEHPDNKGSGKRTQKE